LWQNRTFPKNTECVKPYFGNAWGACACGKPPVGTENATESTSNKGIFREVFLIANHPNHR